MKTNPAKSYKWAYLPFVFSSAAILATSVTAAPGASQQYQDAKQVNSVRHEYVGSGTQAGISITDEGNVGLELNGTLSETANSRTGAGLWADFDLKGDDEGLKGRGVQINHAWVSRDKAGRATHVNKALFAYDRNASGHDKATVGYGQENENLFWDVHASKGLSGNKNSRKVGTRTVSDKSYDYGIGGNVGTFIKDSNVRVRAGLDHEWGEDVGAGESTARNTTLSAGIEKFFQGTPHSLGLDVAASKRSGGLKNGSDKTDVNGRLTYRYDFGGASIYQPDRRYKRVRVEVPSRAVAPRYKSVPTYTKKIVKKPYKQLVKSTVALEGQTFFKLNSAKLIPSAQARLKQIATEIRKNGYKGSIRITGNTCGLGDPVYDQRLSEQRARAVKAFLIKNGFNANRLVARGLGKGHPKYPNTPEQGFKNRRVDIEYVSERKSYRTGYRTEVQNVRTGTKNVLISKGKPGTPRVIWRTETIPTSPAWIKRAMHNNITHSRNVNTYTSTDRVQTTPVNVAPVAVNDVQSVSCSNTPITINVLGNDSDKDGDQLTITRVANGQYGTTQIVGNNVVYTPNGSGCGKADSFDYTISDGKGHTTTATVKVDMAAAVNVAPVAKDDAVTTMQGRPVRLATLSNDSDADGDTLTIKDIQDPAHGTAVVSADGKGIVYTPDADFYGTETFTYTISDGHGHIVTATETVVVKQSAPTNVAPIAQDDMATAYCEAITIKVLDNDSDADNDLLEIIGLSNPSLGTAVVKGNTVVYTPVNSCGTGIDTFTYKISDGNGHTATASVKVDVKGSGGCNTGCTIAEPDDITTTEGTPISINVLSNDSGAGLKIADVDAPRNGAAMIVGNSIKYTPEAGFTGTDSFWYGIVDAKGYETSALIVVYVEEKGCNAQCD